MRGSGLRGQSLRPGRDQGRPRIGGIVVATSCDGVVRVIGVVASVIAGLYALVIPIPLVVFPGIVRLLKRIK